MTGKVSWWSKVKGFGFIFSDEGKDVFVHYEELVGCRNLKKGCDVSFDVEITSKGAQAKNVRIIK